MRITTLAVPVILAISLTATASHCGSYTTSAPEVDTGLYYVDMDFCQGTGGILYPLLETAFTIIQPHKCIFSIWIYQESNEIPGLQRGDEVVDDTCHGMIQADTIVL